MCECVSYGTDVRSMHFAQNVSAPLGENPFWKIVLPVSFSALLANGMASAGAVILPSRLVISGLSRADAVAELGVVSGIASPIMLLPIALLSSLCTVGNASGKPLRSIA